MFSSIRTEAGAEKAMPLKGSVRPIKARFNVIMLAAAVLAIALAMCTGCGPNRAVVRSTPTPTAAPASTGMDAAVIIPEASLPPLPGAMSGATPQPEAEP